MVFFSFKQGGFFFFNHKVLLQITWALRCYQTQVSTSKAVIWQICWWWSHLNLLRPFFLFYHFLFNSVFFSPLQNQARLPSCSSTYSVSEVHFARIFLHGQQHARPLTIYLILFSFCLNLFCLALCTWLKGMRVTKGGKSHVLGGNFYFFNVLLSE